MEQRLIYRNVKKVWPNGDAGNLTSLECGHFISDSDGHSNAVCWTCTGQAILDAHDHPSEKIHLVIGSSGTFDDHSEWNVVAYGSEIEAQKHAALASKAAEMWLVHSSPLNHPPKGVNPYDAQMEIVDHRVDYRVETVELRAESPVEIAINQEDGLSKATPEEMQAAILRHCATSREQNRSLGIGNDGRLTDATIGDPDL